MMQDDIESLKERLRKLEETVAELQNQNSSKLKSEKASLTKDTRNPADIKFSQKDINLFLREQMKTVRDPEVRIAIGKYLNYVDDPVNR